MQIQLFLLLANKYPEAYIDEEASLLLETGLEISESNSVTPTGELRFMTTLLIKSPEAEPALSEFKAWWSEHAGGEVTFEHMASDVTQLAPSRAEALDEMVPGGWSFKSNFVIFCAKSRDAQDEARQLISDCELQSH